MPKYMLVMKGEDGEVWAKFFEELEEADNYRFTAELNGAYAEMYERTGALFSQEYKII